MSIIGRQAIEVLNESIPVEHKIRYIGMDYSKITSISKLKNKVKGGVHANEKERAMAVVSAAPLPDPSYLTLTCSGGERMGDDGDRPRLQQASSLRGTRGPLRGEGRVSSGGSECGGR